MKSALQAEFINNVRAEKRLGMDLNPDTVHQASPAVQVLAQSCSRPCRTLGWTLYPPVVSSNISTPGVTFGIP